MDLEVKYIYNPNGITLFISIKYINNNPNGFRSKIHI